MWSRTLQSQQSTNTKQKNVYIWTNTPEVLNHSICLIQNSVLEMPSYWHSITIRRHWHPFLVFHDHSNGPYILWQCVPSLPTPCYAVLLPCNVMASKLSIDPVSSLKCCVIYLLLQITRHASEPLIAVGQEGSICLLLYLSRTVHAITLIIWPTVRFRSHYLLSNEPLLAEEWGLRTHHAMSAWIQAAVHHCGHIFSVQGQPCSGVQTSECTANASSWGILCYLDLWILIWDQAEHTCWHTRLSQHTVISLHIAVSLQQWSRG